MKITIDTQQDKPEEIRKMCQFLLDLANNVSSSNSSLSSTYTNSQTTTPVDTSSMMNMFGDDNSTSSASIQTSSVIQTPDRAPDFGAFLSLTKNYEKKESTTRPQIEFL